MIEYGKPYPLCHVSRWFSQGSHNYRGIVLNILATISNGFFQSLGSELGHSAGHSIVSNAFLVGYVPIIISIVGFGLITYKVIDEVRHRKGGTVDIKGLAKEVTRQQEK
jgi:hypothetical protein